MRWIIWFPLILIALVGCGGETAVTPQSMPTTAALVTVAISTPTLQPTITPTITLTPSPTSTATTAVTPTATPPMIARERAAGLVMAYNYESWRLVTADSIVSINAVETARLLGGGLFNYAVRDGVVYTVRGKDVVAIDGDETVAIPTLRDETSIFGFVGEWLLIGYLEHDEPPSQTLGTLGAMSLGGAEFVQITQERPYSIPIIAPDGSYAVYFDGSESRAWYADGTSQPLPFGAFKSGAFSPDGSHIALLTGSLDIYDTATQQLVVSSQNPMMGLDGFTFPVWSGNGRWVAFDTYIAEKEPPVGTRLLSLDGTIIDVDEYGFVGFPAFSPDGTLLALYQNLNNKPNTLIIDLTTGEQFDTPFIGLPIGWIEQ